MSLSRKHFIDLADILLRNKPVPKNPKRLSPKDKALLEQWMLIHSSIKTFCYDHNPNFNGSTFDGASGI